MIPIKPASIRWTIAVSGVLLMGCASSQAPNNGTVPVPVTVTSTPTTVTPPAAVPAVPTIIHRGPWNFAYTPGQYRYRLTVTGTVSQADGSVPERAMTPLTLPITFEVGDSITITDPAPTTGLGCSAQRALHDKALHLLPKIPSPLQLGMTWTDSMTIDACSGTIPVQLNILTRYRVAGDTTYNSLTVLQIEKSTTFSAKGEGTDAQHRILLSASGTEIGTLYFDTTVGMFAGSRSMQDTKIDITTSGHTTNFTQRTTETIGRD